MADDIDLAQDREQFMLDALINTRKPTDVPTGRCFNCDEPVATGVYCDAGCREDHERFQRLRAYQGVR